LVSRSDPRMGRYTGSHGAISRQPSTATDCGWQLETDCGRSLGALRPAAFDPLLSYARSSSMTARCGKLKLKVSGGVRRPSVRSRSPPPSVLTVSVVEPAFGSVTIAEPNDCYTRCSVPRNATRPSCGFHNNFFAVRTGGTCLCARLPGSAFSLELLRHGRRQRACRRDNGSAKVRDQVRRRRPLGRPRPCRETGRGRPSKSGRVPATSAVPARTHPQPSQSAREDESLDNAWRNGHGPRLCQLEEQ